MHPHLFLVKVEFPCVLNVEDKEREEVVGEYRRLWNEQEPFHLAEKETEEILDPFQFKI